MAVMRRPNGTGSVWPSHGAWAGGLVGFGSGVSITVPHQRWDNSITDGGGKCGCSTVSAGGELQTLCLQNKLGFQQSSAFFAEVLAATCGGCKDVPGTLKCLMCPGDQIGIVFQAGKPAFGPREVLRGTSQDLLFQ